MAARPSALRREALRTADADRGRRSSFPRLEQSVEPLLSALVVDARRSDRNTERLAGLLDGHVVVEDELENLALSPRQSRQSAKKRGRPFGAHELALRRLMSIGVIGVVLQETEPAQPAGAPMRRARPADHREEPRPERRSPFEAPLPIQNLHLHPF